MSKSKKKNKTLAERWKEDSKYDPVNKTKEKNEIKHYFNVDI